MTYIFLAVFWIVSLVLACFLGWNVGREASANEMMKYGKTRWKGLVYNCDRIFPE